MLIISHCNQPGVAGRDVIRSDLIFLLIYFREWVVIKKLQLEHYDAKSMRVRLRESAYVEIYKHMFWRKTFTAGICVNMCRQICTMQ